MKIGDYVRGVKGNGCSITNENCICKIQYIYNSADKIEVEVLTTTEEINQCEIGRCYDVYLNQVEEITEDELVKLGYIIKPDADCSEIKIKRFRKGDIVKTKTLDELAKYYGRQFDCIGLKGVYGNKIRVSYLDKKAVILSSMTYNEKRYFKIKSKGQKDEYGNMNNGFEVYVPAEILELVERPKIKKEAEVVDEIESIKKEMLSKIDVITIKKMLGAVYQAKAEGVDALLDDWAKAKAPLYLMLGRNIMIEKEMEYEADRNYYSEQLSRLAQDFPALELLLWNGMIDWNDVKNNKVSYASSISCGGRISGIESGMKYSTALSRIIQNKDFDIEYSKVIAEGRVKGKIVISIDPLDFLTMSFNGSGWTSCHTISNEGRARSWGGYAGGILAYISDNHTMISYRCSEKPMEKKIGNSTFKIYSKNWRQLIYADTINNTAIFSRQYPDYNEPISKTVRELYEEKVCETTGLPNQWKKKVMQSSSWYGTYIKDYIKNPLQYNDMLHGYSGTVIYNKSLDNWEKTRMVIGQKPICPKCGQHRIGTDGHGMVCADCR